MPPRCYLFKKLNFTTDFIKKKKKNWSYDYFLFLDARTTFIINFVSRSDSIIRIPFSLSTSQLINHSTLVSITENGSIRGSIIRFFLQLNRECSTKWEKNQRSRSRLSPTNRQSWKLGTIGRARSSRRFAVSETHAEARVWAEGGKQKALILRRRAF